MYGFINKLTIPVTKKIVELPPGVGNNVNAENPADTTNVEVVDEAVQLIGTNLGNAMNVQGNHGSIPMDDPTQTNRNLTKPSAIKQNRNKNKSLS